MIKNIVFDMGNILFTWSPSENIRRLGYTGQDAEVLETEVFLTPEWCSMDRGTLKPAQVARILAQRVPEHLQAAVEPLICHWWEGDLMPTPGIGDLIQELKAGGYGIYLLSNANLALRSYFPRIPGSECFDGLMVSAEEKLLKPNPEIFRTLLERFGLEAERCFFVDDSPANVEGAMSVGLSGCVFKGDTQALRRKLRSAGIRCAE